MTREGIRSFAALVAAILVIGSLAACGGAGSDTTSPASSSATTAARPVSKQPDSNGSGGGTSQTNSKENGGSGESSPGAEAAPLKVSGGGSAQYRVKGGDNSIQEFGEESAESELEEAATSLHDFYVARAEENWPAACSHLAKTVTQQLKQLASQSGKGCAGILSALTPPLPSKVQKELTIVDAGSLRTEDERAFLIYRGAGGTTYAISMVQEDGAWKVGGLAAAPLS